MTRLLNDSISDQLLINLLFQSYKDNAPGLFSICSININVSLIPKFGILLFFEVVVVKIIK